MKIKLPIILFVLVAMTVAHADEKVLTKSTATFSKVAMPTGCGETYLFDIYCVSCEGRRMYCVDTALNIICSGPCLTGRPMPSRTFFLLENLALENPQILVPVPVRVPVAVTKEEMEELRKRQHKEKTP